MLRLLRGTFRNFLAIGEIAQTIDLSIDGLTLVLGENVDLGGGNSRNGCGKTLILQAISYGLFGKPLTRIRLDNLVNNINTKAMLVTIEFECFGKTYRIERGRKPEVLRFFKEGVAQRDDALGKNKHTQVEIERIIGMSHTLFRHIVALNTFTTPFLREEASVQRELIEELFGITQLSQRAEALKKLIDCTKEDLRNAEAQVKANGEANARIEQAIDRTTAEAAVWSAAQERHTSGLAATAEALHAIDIDEEIALFDRIEHWQSEQRNLASQRQAAEQEVEALSREITRLEQEISRHQAEARMDGLAQIERLVRQAQEYHSEADQDNQPQIERLRSELERREKESAKKEDEANRLATELTTIMDALANPDAHRCTTCGQGLAGTNHLAQVSANLIAQQERLADTIGQLLSDQDRLAQQSAAIEVEITELRVAGQEHRQELLDKAAIVEHEIAVARTELAERRALSAETLSHLETVLVDLVAQRRRLMDRLNTDWDLGPMPVSAYKSRDAVWQLRQERARLLDELETEMSKPNPHEAKIEALRGTQIVIDYVDLNELNSRFRHETFLHKLLTAKESFIRKKLIQQNLHFLNKRLDHYLQQLGLPHEVAFQADLTVEISLLGVELDFEQLSRGEMNRVILASSWAFADVWENLNTALNLLFVDEMLDQGTDGAGVEAALEVLTGMATERRKSVFLISHREELRERIENVLVVRKENQFTSFA